IGMFACSVAVGGSMPDRWHRRCIGPAGGAALIVAAFAAVDRHVQSARDWFGLGCSAWSFGVGVAGGDVEVVEVEAGVEPWW
ncbi:MAG TPA: hypothetical protein VGX25_01575, partial [Actinophytocola sp.]|uniref:hypothetical protein n=1 Tax=Actinophytocola sp. TaxID=1872138 RepID=UPI002DDD197C